MPSYISQLGTAASQLLNALLGGWCDESLSSRAWRKSQASWRWSIARELIDMLFFWQPNHCERAYLEDERRRYMMPPELRD